MEHLNEITHLNDFRLLGKINEIVDWINKYENNPPYVKPRVYGNSLSNEKAVECKYCGNYKNKTCSYLFENKDNVCKAFVNSSSNENKDKELSTDEY